MNSTSSHLCQATSFEDCAASVHPPAGTIAPTYRPDRHVFLGRDAPRCVGTPHLGGEANTQRDNHYFNQPCETLRASRFTVANRSEPDPCQDQDFGLTNRGGMRSVAPESCRSQHVTRKRFASAGFTLVEVTLAVAITAVGLLAIYGLMAGSIAASRRISDDSLITSLLEDMLAWGRVTPYGKQSTLPFGAIASNGASVVVETGLDAFGNLRVTEYQATAGGANYENKFWAGNKNTGHGYYRFTWRAVPHPYFPTAPDICRVVITVEWPINVHTGQPMPNANRRHYVTTITKRADQF